MHSALFGTSFQFHWIEFVCVMEKQQVVTPFVGAVKSSRTCVCVGPVGALLWTVEVHLCALGTSFWCLVLILLDCVYVCDGETKGNKCVELENCEGTLVPVFIKDNTGEHCACVRWDNCGARCSKLYLWLIFWE